MRGVSYRYQGRLALLKVQQSTPRLLMDAGASGVGCAAIQSALSMGCEVFTTASSDKKLAALRKFLTIDRINYRQQCFVDEIKRLTQGQGVDIIIDFVGGDHLAKSIVCAALDATIVQLAMLGGALVIDAILRGDCNGGLPDTEYVT